MVAVPTRTPRTWTDVVADPEAEGQGKAVIRRVLVDQPSIPRDRPRIMPMANSEMLVVLVILVAAVVAAAEVPVPAARRELRTVVMAMAVMENKVPSRVHRCTTQLVAAVVAVTPRTGDREWVAKVAAEMAETATTHPQTVSPTQVRVAVEVVPGPIPMSARQTAAQALSSCGTQRLMSSARPSARPMAGTRF